MRLLKAELEKFIQLISKEEIRKNHELKKKLKNLSPLIGKKNIYKFINKESLLTN